jgi:hypothetical protein
MTRYEKDQFVLMIPNRHLRDMSQDLQYSCKLCEECGTAKQSWKNSRSRAGAMLLSWLKRVCTMPCIMDSALGHWLS